MQTTYKFFKFRYSFIKCWVLFANLGNISSLRKNRVIIRLDGVGLDSENIDFNKTKVTVFKSTSKRFLRNISK